MATPERPLMDALVQLSFAVTSTLTQVGSTYDVSLTHMRLLGVLRDHAPTMSELAEHLGLDRSSVSGLVDRATTRGLVRRVASDVDRRSSRVELTAAGQAFAAEVGDAVATRIEPLVDTLTARDRDRLVRLLRHVLLSA